MAKVKVIKENDSGRNILFQDTKNNQKMTLKQFVEKIENPKTEYNKDYYIRNINGIKTPVSKPDGKKNNNLG